MPKPKPTVSAAKTNKRTSRRKSVARPDESATDKIAADSTAAVKPVPAKLPSAWRLLRAALSTLRSQWRLFLGITVVYAVLSIVLVGGYGSSLDAETIKTVIATSPGKIAGSLGVFAVLFTSTGASSGQMAGGYQLLLILVVSLALIWALRHVLAGTASLRVRDAFYKGMYPLVPVVLVAVVIMLQLVPLIIASSIFGLIVSGAVTTLIEQVILGAVALALAGLSLYWVVGSVFALYVAALPDMTPVKALRSAKGLVRGRHLPVLRKLLFLPLAIFLGNLVIVVPVLLTVTAAAPFVLYVLFLAALPLVQSYMYMMYRELLQ